jgi:hypothetical protein
MTDSEACIPALYSGKNLAWWVPVVLQSSIYIAQDAISSDRKKPSVRSTGIDPIGLLVRRCWHLVAGMH